ncbi:MAG: porin family protein [bacterium]|nr:porin family protein [bacterium]
MRPSLRSLCLPLAGLLLLCVLAPTSALAEEGEVDWSRTGPYLGASLVGGRFLVLADDLEEQLVPLGLEIPRVPGTGPGSTLGIQNSIEHDFSIGYDVFVGYRVHKYVAAEAEFEWLTDVAFDENGGTFVDGDTMTFAASVRAILPLGRFEPFAVVGIGAMYANLEDAQRLGVMFEDGTDFLWKVGGGFDFHLTEQVGVRFSTDYMRPKGNIHALEHASVGGGLFYRF